MNSTSFNKQALNINDSNKGTHKNTININNSTGTAARDRITCSQIFGFGEKSKYNAGNTDVYLNGKLVWSEGELKTHDYTDGEKDNACLLYTSMQAHRRGSRMALPLLPSSAVQTAPRRSSLPAATMRRHCGALP